MAKKAPAEKHFHCMCLVYFDLCYILELCTKASFSEVVARRCSVKMVFLEISQNSHENTCTKVSFLIKLQATFSYRTPSVATFVLFNSGGLKIKTFSRYSKQCTYLVFPLSIFRIIWNQRVNCVKSSRIRTYSGKYSVRIRENADQNNSKCWHFLRSSAVKQIWNILILWAPTAQNIQTHSNNSSLNCRPVVWVCLAILWGWRLKG